ncbi:MAG: enoyl-CoA hydratase/isomerase family protein [Syntrophomonadaceae bacterium]|jgi:enoyl-CoA hydratase|nr:enoyl-CoA hydratase/isomerase family protein [Syntrophomonadaceae bacterium]
MSYKTLILEKENNRAVLSLNQPHTKNSMSHELKNEFGSAIQEIRKDKELKVLVITGEGDSFCSGGDLNSAFFMMDDAPVEGKTKLIEFYKSFLSLRDLAIPTIAAINGYAVGAGLCLALACDMRIAADNAKMSMSFIKLGLHPGMGATYLLPRLVGAARAFEIFLTGKIILAEEALRIGLVNQVVGADQLRDAALDLAAQIAGYPAVPARYLKNSIYKGLDTDLGSALDYESFAQVVCASTQDMREGINALKEKRPPVFKGF